VSDIIFLEARKALHVLLAGGFETQAGIAALVELKDSEFAMRFDRAIFFDPRKLDQLVREHQL
jgi:hypothetical protein